MKIYFLRHLKTKGNFEKRYIGSTDECLFDVENQDVSKILPINPNKIFCSPMKRCIQTKDIFYKDLDCEIIDNLKEMSFGFFENKTYEDLKDNVHYRNFIDGTESPLDGESTENFKGRCCNAFNEIIEKSNENDTIVIVCHGGTIMSIMEKFEFSQKGFYSYQIGNGQVLVCTYTNGILKIEENV